MSTTDETKETKDESDTSTKGEGKFSQEDLNRIAAREKDQGQRAGVDAALKALGIKDLDEGKAILEAAREAEEQRLSDTEKASKKAQEAERKADEKNALAEKTLLDARKLAALVGSGLKMVQAKEVVELVKAQADSDDAAIETAIQDLKTRLPQLFTEVKADGDQDGTKKTPPSSNPAKGATGNSSQPDAAAKTRELLHSRHPHLKKS